MQIQKYVSYAWLLVLNCVHKLASENVTEASPKLSRVWGPGLNPILVLPVRYFFIQAVGDDGLDFKASAGADLFSLKVEGLEKSCRIFKELLDRKDGSYIARFRLYEPCDGLKISITTSKRLHIAESPYIFGQKILHSDCNCPIALENWKHVSVSLYPAPSPAYSVHGNSHFNSVQL